MQKCIKLRIIKPYGELSWDELGQTFRDTMYIASKAANYVMRECYLHAIAKYNGEHTKKLYCYPQLAAMYPATATHILNRMERTAKNKWSQHAKDVLSSKISLPTFKQGLPAHLHNENYKVKKIEENYIIDAQLRSETHKPTRYQFIVAATDKSTKIILERILNGEYKQGEAQLTIDRKGKWYFIIPYQFEAAYHDIDKSNIMGVDLGITKAAYWAFTNSHKRGWIAGSEIEEFRRRVRKRRIEIQNQGKYCGEGRIGHGTARHLLPIDILSEKEANFRNTCNQRYAHRIVDEALRMKCGIIQMEDLTNISSNSKFLKNWPYYDLQSKILNKAAEYGIEVHKVDPQYTSQRCSNCGHIDKDSRLDQATFICTACGYGNLHHCFACGAKQKEGGVCEKCGDPTKHLAVNADYNAARNLAIEGIADIIISTLTANGVQPLPKKKANRKRA
jgi:putative transposase